MHDGYDNRELNGYTNDMINSRLKLLIVATDQSNRATTGREDSTFEDDEK